MHPRAPCVLERAVYSPAIASRRCSGAPSTVVLLAGLSVHRALNKTVTTQSSKFRSHRTEH